MKSVKQSCTSGIKVKNWKRKVHLKETRIKRPCPYLEIFRGQMSVLQKSKRMSHTWMLIFVSADSAKKMAPWILGTFASSATTFVICDVRKKISCLKKK